MAGRKKFNNGVRHRQLEVCEDDQSIIALLGFVTCECDEYRKLRQHVEEALE